MTGLEIKKQLIGLERKLMSLDKSEFVISKETAEILKRQQELRFMCPHEYKEGYCIYCYKKE